MDVLFGLAAEGVAYALVVWGPLKWLPAALKAFVLSLCVALVIGVELVLMTGAPLWAVCPGLFAGTLVVVEAGCSCWDILHFAMLFEYDAARSLYRDRALFFGNNIKGGGDDVGGPPR